MEGNALDASETRRVCDAVTRGEVGEVVVSLLDVTKCVRARLACTIYTSIYEGIIRRDEPIPETVQREHIDIRWELSPGNRRSH